MKKVKDRIIQYVTYRYKNSEEYEKHKEEMKKSGFKAIKTMYPDGDQLETNYEKVLKNR